MAQEACLGHYQEYFKNIYSGALSRWLLLQKNSIIDV